MPKTDKHIPNDPKCYLPSAWSPFLFFIVRINRLWSLNTMAAELPLLTTCKRKSLLWDHGCHCPWVILLDVYYFLRSPRSTVSHVLPWLRHALLQPYLVMPSAVHSAFSVSGYAQFIQSLCTLLPQEMPSWAWLFHSTNLYPRINTHIFLRAIYPRMLWPLSQIKWV